jgi:hypothetical protein
MRFTPIIGTLILLSTLLLSCTPPSTFGSLDLDQWRKDKAGCDNKRIEMKDALLTEKELLLGKSSNEIGKLFRSQSAGEKESENVHLFFRTRHPMWGHCADFPGTKGCFPF